MFPEFPGNVKSVVDIDNVLPLTVVFVIACDVNVSWDPSRSTEAKLLFGSKEYR